MIKRLWAWFRDLPPYYDGFMLRQEWITALTRDSEVKDNE